MGCSKYFFWKKQGEQHEKLLAELVRILTEYEDGYLDEMLGLLAPMYGEGSVLTIANLSDRGVLASTDKRTDEVTYMLKSIKEIDRKCYYLRHEKNSIRYRADCNCVRIVPLTYRGSCSHSLVIEQLENKQVVMDRCIELVALAVKNYVMEKIVSDNCFVDVRTGLPNREQFILEAKRAYGTKALYMGLISLMRDDIISQGISLEEYDGYAGIAAGVLKKTFSEQVYCIGENLFALFLCGRVYECVAKMQDAMDILCDNKSLIVNGAIALLDQDIYKTMYLCEKACEKARHYTVMLIRDRDIDLNVAEESYESFYCENKGEEESTVGDAVFEETVKTSKSETVSDNSKDTAETESENSFAFFFDNTDTDTVLDDI